MYSGVFGRSPNTPEYTRIRPNTPEYMYSGVFGLRIRPNTMYSGVFMDRPNTPEYMYSGVFWRIRGSPEYARMAYSGRIKLYLGTVPAVFELEMFSTIHVVVYSRLILISCETCCASYLLRTVGKALFPRPLSCPVCLLSVCLFVCLSI
jgi:hypothetical protein